jgi:hypothetical protein
MVRYRMSSDNLKIEERFAPVHTGGVGEDAKFTDVSTGWWALMPGNLAVFLGNHKPNRASLVLEIDS